MVCVSSPPSHLMLVHVYAHPLLPFSLVLSAEQGIVTSHIVHRRQALHPSLLDFPVPVLSVSPNSMQQQLVRSHDVNLLPPHVCLFL